LYRSLCELSHTHDAQVCEFHPGATLVAVKRLQKADAFARTVADQIDIGPLPYSRRLRLLQAAQQQGIDRFEANLMIARVEHRLTLHQYDAAAPPGSTRLGRWAVVGLLAMLVQSALVLGAWSLLR
jgi:hypothetical protein